MATRRLFIAVYPPADIAGTLLDRAAALGLPGARPVQHGHVHLTVLFIGDTDDRDLPRVQESLERSVAGLSPFPLVLTGLRSFPHDGPPRLVAASGDASPTLLEVHARLVTRLARPGRRVREAFIPHLTLARYGPSGGPTIHQPWPAPHPAFDVPALALVESTLRPDRAHHRPLATVPFPGR